MRLLIRVFTECADDAAARGVGQQLGGAIERSLVGHPRGLPGMARALRAAQAPLRYGKDIPRFALPLFEHAWWLEPATLDDVRALMALASQGWSPACVEDALLQLEVDEEGSWVWNRDAAGAWLLPEVAWVELAYQHDG